MMHFPHRHQQKLERRTGMRLAGNTVSGFRTDLDTPDD
ncbi:MAG: hypothetical protein QG638_2055, partial [Pseudomonadota bacterium]|nr:hypothetical protein [Pseudomonadota bacterium]